MQIRLLLVFTLAIASTAGVVRAQSLPIADAGPDQTIECAAAAATDVRLDGSASTPDGQALSFAWTSPAFAGTATGPRPTVQLPLGGPHEITLTVDDGVDGTSTDTVLVTIEDTTPPVLEMGGDPVELWPPNHKYHRVRVARFVTSVSDTCEGDLERYDVRVEEATSDEGETSRGSGHTLDDILLVEDCRAVDLRAERQGRGNGRVYEARLVATDGGGNQTVETVEIAHVRKSRGRRGNNIVDDGDAFVVDGPCESTLDLCPVEPAMDCMAGRERGSRLSLRRSRRNRARDALRWDMRAPDGSEGDFGDPKLDTDYQLCVYADDGVDAELIMDPGARAGERWRSRRRGFRFRGGRDSREGLDRIVLRFGDGRRGRIAVRGRGPRLDVPDLPIHDDLVVQLHNSDGVCWSATFDDPRRNNERRYRAVGD